MVSYSQSHMGRIVTLVSYRRTLLLLWSIYSFPTEEITIFERKHQTLLDTPPSFWKTRKD